MKRILRDMILLTLVVGSFFSIAAPFRRAWQIERNGVRSVVLGTDHGIRLSESELPPRLRDELAKASRVYLEMYPLPSDDHMSTLSWRERRIQERFGLLHLLSVEAADVLRRLFPSIADLEVVTTLNPGSAYILTERRALESMNEIRLSYMHMVIAALNGHLPGHVIDESFDRYQMDSTLRRYAREFYGSDDPVVILRKMSERADVHREFLGVDAVIASWAIRERKKIYSLSAFEPLARGEARYKALVRLAELDQDLQMMSTRLNPRNGEIYFFDATIRPEIYQLWSERDYFADFSAEEYVAISRALSAEGGGGLASLPTARSVSSYDFGRHRHWIAKLAREAERRSLFIAVGLAHLVPYTEGEADLLDLFRAHGFRVSEWEGECGELLTL